MHDFIIFPKYGYLCGGGGGRTGSRCRWRGRSFLLYVHFLDNNELRSHCFSTSGWDKLRKWPEPRATSGPALQGSVRPLGAPHGILIRGLAPSGNIESRERCRKRKVCRQREVHAGFTRTKSSFKKVSRRASRGPHTHYIGESSPVGVSQSCQEMFVQGNIETQHKK